MAISTDLRDDNKRLQAENERLTRTERTANVLLLRIKCGGCDFTGSRFRRESNGITYPLPHTFDAGELRTASKWMVCPKCGIGDCLFELAPVAAPPWR